MTLNNRLLVEVSKASSPTRKDLFSLVSLSISIESGWNPFLSHFVNEIDWIPTSPLSDRLSLGLDHPGDSPIPEVDSWEYPWSGPFPQISCQWRLIVQPFDISFLKFWNSWWRYFVSSSTLVTASFKRVEITFLTHEFSPFEGQTLFPQKTKMLLIACGSFFQIPSVSLIVNSISRGSVFLVRVSWLLVASGKLVLVFGCASCFGPWQTSCREWPPWLFLPDCGTTSCRKILLLKWLEPFPLPSLWLLVATIHFSPFTCCFRKFFRRSFTGFFRNENAEFTQSLLCSLFTKFTGECNHSHVHSLFTANGSSECSSIHVSIGDTKTAQFIENKQTNRSGKGGRIAMRCRGFIPITNHANDHYWLSSVHSEWFTNHSNHIHTFTPITRIVATKLWLKWLGITNLGFQLNYLSWLEWNCRMTIHQLKSFMLKNGVVTIQLYYPTTTTV